MSLSINLSSLHLMDFFPWILSALSMTCVYCLNNYKVKLGRYLGLIVACGWFFFGYITTQWFFLFTNVIYAYIYISAIVKFNQKREEYKHITEEQALRLQEVESKLEKERLRVSSRLKAKHARMKKITLGALERAELVTREMRVLLKSLERLDAQSHLLDKVEQPPANHRERNNS